MGDNIKASHIKIMIILISLFTLTLLNMLVFNISNIYIISAIILLFILLIKFTIGYERSKNRYFKDTMMNIFIIVMLYYIFTYITGIFVGFIRTGYSITFLNLIRNMLPVIIIILTVEVLRYMVNKKIIDDKKLLILSSVVFVLIDIMFKTELFNLNRGADIVSIVSLIIFPAIGMNILLSYTSINFGFMPAIFYRILMELPEYFLPIFPNFNEYINAIIAFLLPLLILYLISRTIKKKEKKDSSLEKNILNRIFTILMIIVMVIIIFLTSGMFKYYVISIGSGSMQPNLNVGDVAIVEKIDDPKIIEEQDILVFEQNDIVVVHRVEEIKYENDEYKFITKGDNNKEIDNWVVNENEILGIVNFKIPYVGYPTVWLNNQIN